MKNFDDEFLQLCYPNVNLKVLKCLKIRIGEPFELFGDLYKKEVLIDYLEITERTYNHILFLHKIINRKHIKATDAFKIIYYVENIFSIYNRSTEREEYIKQKNMPEHVRLSDYKYQKAA